MATSQTLISTCSAAYDIATSCVSHPTTCDIVNSTKKLQVLNDQRLAAEAKLANLTKDLFNIIPEAHKN